MDFLTFTDHVLNSLAWPAVVVVLLVHRPHLTGRTARLEMFRAARFRGW